MVVKRISYALFLILSLSIFAEVQAQRYVTTFGIQYKPIFYNQLFRTRVMERSLNNLNLRIEPLKGNVFGMVVRRGLSDTWSFESGINLVTRYYNAQVSENGSGLEGINTDFQLLSYELPAQALVYVRLGENMYLNASGGLSFGIFPSDVQTFNNDFEHYTFRKTLFSASLLSNVGFEYRTKKSGYFYLGASYLLALTNPYVHQVANRNTNQTLGMDGLQTGYFTLDLRYFFHEEPNEMTKKRIKDRDEKRQRRLFEMGFDVEDPDAKKKAKKLRKEKREYRKRDK